MPRRTALEIRDDKIRTLEANLSDRIEQHRVASESLMAARDNLRAVEKERDDLKRQIRDLEALKGAQNEAWKAKVKEMEERREAALIEAAETRGRLMEIRDQTPVPHWLAETRRMDERVRRGY